MLWPHLNGDGLSVLSQDPVCSAVTMPRTNVPEDVEAAPGHREHAGDSEHHRAKHLDVVCTRRVSSARG